MGNYYFDYNSTTPLRKEVKDILINTYKDYYGNPSGLYKEGREAKAIIEISRKQVADSINAEPEEVFFTSGGTEANNLAFKGLADLYKRGKTHIITSAIEHSSIYQTTLSLKKQGIDVTYIPVDKNGKIDITSLEQSITEKTALISIMTANNETGVIQEIKRISSIAQTNGIIFHSDAIQALGKIPLDINNPSVDLLSLSAHKLYGPKGIGALYKRKGVSISPLIDGGGQEKNIRSGTENVPLIAGFGEACRLLGENSDNELKHLQHLKKKLYRGLTEKIKCTKLNGLLNQTLPNTLNMSFPGCESETLVLELDIAGFSVSAGAACSSIRKGGSRVLKAMDLKPAELFSSIRFSFGRETKEFEIDLLIDKLSKIIGQFV